MDFTNSGLPCVIIITKMLLVFVTAYFQDNYIGRQRSGTPREIPMFPLEIWNMHGRTIVHLPRTNNHVERWHKLFLNSCGGPHQNIWKVVKILQNVERLIYAEIQYVSGGHLAIVGTR